MRGGSVSSYERPAERQKMQNKLTNWLEARFPKVTAYDFYRCIFPVGELDKKDAMTKGKYTAIICCISDTQRWDSSKEKYRTKVYRYTLTDELDAINEAVQSDDFCICSPLSYVGKRRTAENARKLYAIAIDLDKIRDRGDEPIGLVNLWERHIQTANRVPRPTFIVSSGSGLHLYYVLDKPIDLFQDTVFELQELKRELTRIVWHDTIVNISSAYDIQQEGIYQGFRMPDTMTKYGDRAKAFQTGERVTLDYLNSFVSAIYKAKQTAERQRWQQTHINIADAKDKYPDWYDRRVLRKEPRGAIPFNRALYDWWKREITEKATVGHRYYCLMALAIYARKCGKYDAKHNPNPVTYKELEADSLGFLDHMERLTVSADNHFDRGDILDALEAYQDRWLTYPRKNIEYRTGITIPVNKRNGRKREEHIKLMNYVREELNNNKSWYGRKSQLEVVRSWRAVHPNGRKVDCILETGLSKPTVYKHWNAAEPMRINELVETARKSSMELKSQIENGDKLLDEIGKLLSELPPREKEKYMDEYLELAASIDAVKGLFR